MLHVSNIRYQFSSAIVTADFSAEDGECIALMGPSGCGKTTTLDLIAGFRDPQQGDIIYRGSSLVGQSPGDRPLSYLFQQHNLFPHLSVFKNIGIGIDPGLKLNREAHDRVKWALASVGLDGFNDRKPDQLSGGQQQRVGLARCLVRDKPILLLDEPFSALDQSIRNSIIDLVNQLREVHQFTLVISTHQHSDAIALGARIHDYGEAPYSPTV